MQAYYKVKSRCFLNIIIIKDRFYFKSQSFTSVYHQYGKCYTIKTVSRLVLYSQAYYMVNLRCFHNIIIIEVRF